MRKQKQHSLMSLLPNANRITNSPRRNLFAADTQMCQKTSSPRRALPINYSDGFVFFANTSKNQPLRIEFHIRVVAARPHRDAFSIYVIRERTRSVRTIVLFLVYIRSYRDTVINHNRSIIVFRCSTHSPCN